MNIATKILTLPTPTGYLLRKILVENTEYLSLPELDALSQQQLAELLRVK